MTMNNKEKLYLTKIAVGSYPQNFPMSPLQGFRSGGQKSDGGAALGQAAGMLADPTGLIGQAGNAASRGLKTLGSSLGSLAGAGVAKAKGLATPAPKSDEIDSRTNSPEHQQAVQDQNTSGTPAHKAHQDKVNKSKGNIKSVPGIGGTSYPTSKSPMDFLKNMKGIGAPFMRGR